MVDGQTFLDQPLTNDLGTHENIQKVASGQVDDYTSAFF